MNIVHKLFVLIVCLILFQPTIYAQETPDTPYTSKTGDYTLFRPGLWIVTGDERGIVTIVDSYTTKLLFSEQLPLGSGQLVLQIFKPNTIGLNPQQAIDTFMKTLELEGLEQEEIIIGDQPALRLSGDIPFAVYAYTTRNNETGFSILMYSGGELAQAQRRAIAVLETVTTASLETRLEAEPAQQLRKTYEGDTLPIMFDYPGGWGINDLRKPGSIIISNDATFIDDDLIEQGYLSSRMYFINPAGVDFRLVDDASLQDIAEFLVEQDIGMNRPDFIVIDGLERDALLAYENGFTRGELSLLLLRIDEDMILVWDVNTFDNQLPNYYATLKAILATVQVNTNGLDIDPVSDTLYSMELNLRNELELTFDTVLSYSGISDFALSPNEQQFAVTVEDSAYVIDLSSGDILQEFPLPDPGKSVNFSPDGEILFVVGGGYPSDGPYRMNFWDLETGASMSLVNERFEYAMDDGMFNSDGTIIVLMSSIETSGIYDAETGDVISTFENVGKLVADFNGQYYAMGVSTLRERGVKLVDAKSLKILSYILIPEDALLDNLLFSPDSNRLALVYTGIDGGIDRVGIVDVELGKVISETQNTVEFPIPEVSIEGISSIALTPDNKVIALAINGTITFYEVDTGQPLARISLGQDDIFGLAFTQDGRTMYSAGEDNIIRIWDVAVVRN